MSYVKLLIIVVLLLVSGCNYDPGCKYTCEMVKYDCSRHPFDVNKVMDCLNATPEEVRLDCVNICMPERFKE